MMYQQLVPVLQSLLATSIWATGSALAHTEQPTDDPLDPLGLLTAQLLDAEAITRIAETNLGNLLQDADGLIQEIASIGELQPFVHQMLTSRLLEQPQNPQPAVDILQSLLLLNTSVGSAASAQIASALYNALDTACADVSSRLDVLDVNARSAIQQLAGLSSIDVNLREIKALLDKFLSENTEAYDAQGSYVRAYLTKVIRRFATIPLPDLEAERLIPVDRIYVAPTIKLESNRQVETPLDLMNTCRRAVLLGQPGGGKSTLSGVLMHSLARTETCIPFMITLRKYGKDFEAGLSFVEHIEKLLNTEYQREPPPSMLTDLLTSGKAVIIFDGLDELIDSSRRREIRDAVESFAYEYPFTRILVTSRVVGYEQAPLGEPSFETAHLGEFSPAAVETYVDKWFRNVATGLTIPERINRIADFLRESSSVADLTKNPLLLSLMCVLYRGNNYIPESRLDLYEECAKLLFRRWDRSRDIIVPLELDADIESSIMHLALWILECGHAEEGVPEHILIRECAKNLVPRRYEHYEDAERVAEEFVKFCRGRAWVLADAGSSLDDGRPLFTFAHRTFLEYYAACHIARVCGTPEAIAHKIADRVAAAEWDMVNQLALLLANKNHDRGADRVVTTLLDTIDAEECDEPSRKHTLEFISNALHYVVMAPEVVRRATRAVYSCEVGGSRTSRNGQQSISLNALMSSRLASRRIAASELRELVCADLEKCAHVPPYVTTLITLARALPSMGGRYARDQLYDFWAEWSDSLLKDHSNIVKSEVAQNSLAAIGALESGLISLHEFTQWFSITQLWNDIRIPSWRFNRVGTFALLDGYVYGRYVDKVLRPGAANILFGALIETVPELHFPLDATQTMRLPRLSRQVVPNRFGLIEQKNWPGAVLLHCMTHELRRLQATSQPTGQGSLRYIADPETEAQQSKRSEQHVAIALATSLIARHDEKRKAETWKPARSLQGLWDTFPPRIRKVLLQWVSDSYFFWGLGPRP